MISKLAIGRENAVKSGEVDAWPGHQCRQPANELQQVHTTRVVPSSYGVFGASITTASGSDADRLLDVQVKWRRPHNPAGDVPQFNRAALFGLAVGKARGGNFRVCHFSLSFTFFICSISLNSGVLCTDFRWVEHCIYPVVSLRMMLASLVPNVYYDHGFMTMVI